jgi:hypothetical protein
LLTRISEFIGIAHLTSPQAIAYLGRLLKHDEPKVRESAAAAAITMGPFARDLVPALIALPQTRSAISSKRSWLPCGRTQSV